jgi:hypothetical protein
MFNLLSVRVETAFHKGIVMIGVSGEFLDGLKIEMIEKAGGVLALMGLPAQKEI